MLNMHAHKVVFCALCFRFYCNICSAYSGNKDWYKEHVKQHNSEGPNYICPLCGMGFKTIHLMNSHRTVHKKGTKYTCEFCSKEFYARNQFRLHIKRFHSGLYGALFKLLSTINVIYLFNKRNTSTYMNVNAMNFILEILV